MIDFTLSREQRLLEQSVREWAAREVRPSFAKTIASTASIASASSAAWRSSACSASRCRRSTAAPAWTTSRSASRAKSSSTVDTSLRVIMSVHAGLNCLSLLAWGTEDQKQRYLVPQAQGKKIAGYGLTEPGAGSDARAIQTTAVKKGDRYLLTGEKSWISLADVADNFLVFAWTDLEKKKQRDPVRHQRLHRRAHVQGLFERPDEGEVGHPRRQHRLLQDGRRRGAGGESAGRVGEGFKIAMFALDQGRFTVAAGATGLIRACRDASVKYAKERKTFGVEIGQHQLVKEMIAQMESDYQAARLLWLRSGWLKNHGTAQHAGDRPGEVVRDRRVRARGRRRGADSRRQRLLGRVSGRPLLSATARARSSTKARAKSTS